jgi:Caspase domain
MTRVVSYAGAVTFAVFLAPIWTGSALADHRVALVIGNSAYQIAAAIPNPIRDAQAIAAEFTKAGFEVVSAHYDLGNLQFKRAIRQFEDAAADADIAVVFYAGHGIEIGGVNYMIPVDAKLASDRDAKDEAITLDRLLDSVDAAKRLGLVILDACRDNPFERTMKRQRVSAVRTVNAGLAVVEPTNRNVLIAYASKSGTTAEDGDQQHSPFTAALLKSLFEPGLDLRLAFGRVRDDVLKSTRNRQEPFVYGSLGGTNISLVPAPAKPTLAVDLSGERRDYELVEKIGTKGAWSVFITQHPTGFYTDLARQQLAKLAMVEEGDAPTATRKAPGEGQKFGALEPNRPPSPPSPSSEEQRAWDRIKDSSDTAKFRDFVKQYPSSVLANTARTRLEALERAAREREEQARAEREAKAAEAARQKAEREAALKRAEEDRLAKLAEAARAKQEAAAEAARRAAGLEEQARAEREAKAAEAARQKAEREAALKRAEEDRLAKLAEAARAKQEAAAEAARRAAGLEEQARAEREAKAAEDARQKAEREAALERAAREREEQARAERAAKAAEAARQKAEREAALKRAEEDRLAKLAEAARAKQEAAAEAARQKAEREAALERAAREREEQARAEREAKAAEAAQQEAAVKRAEEGRLAKLSETDRAQEEAACEHEADRLASLKTVRNQSKARQGLKRLEEELTCERLRGSVTAALEKLERMTTEPERPTRREKARQEEARPRPVARQKEEDERPGRRQKVKREEEKPRQTARPQVRQEASSVRSRPIGGGGGGGGAMVGVGF